MAVELSDEQWKPIDEWILKGWVINAIKGIREATGVDIPQAIDICQERYAILRESRPGEFVHGPDEYWSEVYS